MLLVSILIMVLFGAGTALATWLLLAPHWLWLVPAYFVGSFLGLFVLWLVFLASRRKAPQPQPEAGFDISRARQAPAQR